MADSAGNPCCGTGLVLPLAGLAGRGGAAGLVDFRRGLISYLEDLFSLSFRRIAALASLTLKEAVRRKALLVFVMFAVLLMFAGWFITDSNERAELQVSVHVTFLLTAISWLLLPALIFSAAGHCRRTSGCDHCTRW